jgi:predicted nucleic acid-binding protein
MVILDSTTLLLLFYPDADPAVDPRTGQPVTQCKERIAFLLQKLSEDRTQALIPTPVLSEVLVATGTEKVRVLNEIANTYAFRIEPFDMRAAVEVAAMTEAERNTPIGRIDNETKAKVKYDRQIIAIAKVNGVTRIYSDDTGLAKKASALGITVVATADLELPPRPPQGDLPLPEPSDDE